MSDDLVEQMKGRAKFCRDRGEIKTPELLEQGFARIEALTAERDRMRLYAGHDDDCTINRYPTTSTCSCGLRATYD